MRKYVIVGNFTLTQIIVKNRLNLFSRVILQHSIPRYCETNHTSKREEEAFFAEKVTTLPEGRSVTIKKINKKIQKIGSSKRCRAFKHDRFLRFQSVFLCHIVNEHQSITVSRPTADETRGGISTESILESQNTINALFGHTRYLFLFFSRTLKSLLGSILTKIAPIRSIGSVRLRIKYI